MSTLHFEVDEDPVLADLIDHLLDGAEVSIDRSRQPVARLVPASRRVRYVGLYGNHPYEVRKRPRPCPPMLGPDDFMD